MSEKELLHRIDSLENKLDILLGLFQGSNSFVSIKSDCKYTLYSWLAEWLTVYKLPEVKPKTLQCMKINIDKHLKPYIEDKNVNEITTLDLKKVLNRITYSRTRKDVFDILNGSFRVACQLDIIVKNPMDIIKTPKHKRKQGQALTIKEQEEFLKLIEKHKHRDLFIFYMLTGCRMTEALTIEWSDIDFENNVLHIKGTKTDLSDRKIPLFPEVAELLRGYFASGERLFNVSGECLKSSFRRLKDRYKLPYSIKDLRHTFATRCYENGISLKTIQKWLGHSKLDTTANIYTHITSEFEKSEIEKYNPKIPVI